MIRRFDSRPAGFTISAGTPNQLAPVAAPIASQFHVVRLGRRATEQHWSEEEE
jgi:hypothetical protein